LSNIDKDVNNFMVKEKNNFAPKKFSKKVIAVEGVADFMRAGSNSFNLPL